MFRVSDGVREVLDEVTAPHDVEELEAAADGQDRNVALEGGLQERHLGAIATRLRLVRLRVRLCAVRIRPDVGTAGEDDPVEDVEDVVDVVVRRRDQNGPAACSLDRGHVVERDERRRQVPRAPARGLRVRRDPDDRLPRHALTMA